MELYLSSIRYGGEDQGVPHVQRNAVAVSEKIILVTVNDLRMTSGILFAFSLCTSDGS